MKYKGIIFDLDGVICHTHYYHFQAWKRIADELGIHFNEQINNRLRGVSRMESLEIILEQYEKALSEEDKIKLANKKNKEYRKLLEQISPQDLSEDVKATLHSLRDMEIKLAIGSSSKNTKFILSRLGLSDSFDAISDGNNISKSKPDPEVFIKAAEMIGLEPKECLVVEDAAAGIEAATKGGFDSAGIGEVAKNIYTTYPIDTFYDIEKIVRQI